MRYVVCALLILLYIGCTSIWRTSRGTYAAREHALRKQVLNGRTTDREVVVRLKPWHSLLAEHGYMGSVLMIPCRPGDVVRQIQDDEGNTHVLNPPFRALDKGTLMIHIVDLAAGDLNLEWRRLRA